MCVCVFADVLLHCTSIGRANNGNLFGIFATTAALQARYIDVHAVRNRGPFSFSFFPLLLLRALISVRFFLIDFRIRDHFLVDSIEC